MGWFKNYINGPSIKKFIDLRGKNIIVTGANSGVGLMTAHILSLLGARVVLACRSTPKAETTLNYIKEQHKAVLDGRGEKGLVELIQTVPKNNIVKEPEIEYIQLDLKSKESIEAFVEEYTRKYGELHVLINNAGIRRPPALWRTEQNFEIQTGVNYLGHFYLTNLLVPNLTLKNGQTSRVINVSCYQHRYNHLGKTNFDDLNWNERKYNPFLAYTQSKLFNIIFSNELNRRLSSRGIFSNSVNPGFIPNSQINRYLPERRKRLNGAFRPIAKHFAKDLYHGAQTSVFLATDPSVEGVGGKFFTNSKERNPSGKAQDPDSGPKLWEASEKIWNVKFDHTAKQ